MRNASLALLLCLALAGCKERPDPIQSYFPQDGLVAPSIEAAIAWPAGPYDHPL
jgi:hypothetical protein